MAIVTAITSRAKGGFRSHVYRDNTGRTYNAKIVGPGSVSGYKIRIESRRSTGSGASVNLDNVPLATSLKGATAAIQPRIN